MCCFKVTSKGRPSYLLALSPKGIKLEVKGKAKLKPPHSPLQCNLIEALRFTLSAQSIDPYVGSVGMSNLLGLDQVLHDFIENRTEAGSSMSRAPRSEEHTSELQSLRHLVCRLLLEK